MKSLLDKILYWLGYMPIPKNIPVIRESLFDVRMVKAQMVVDKTQLMSIREPEMLHTKVQMDLKQMLFEEMWNHIEYTSMELPDGNSQIEARALIAVKK